MEKKKKPCAATIIEILFPLFAAGATYFFLDEKVGKTEPFSELINTIKKLKLINKIKKERCFPAQVYRMARRSFRPALFWQWV